MAFRAAIVVLASATTIAFGACVPSGEELRASAAPIIGGALAHEQRRLADIVDEQVDTSAKAALNHLLEDTRGLHRAQLPQTGYRDLGYAVFMPLRPFYRYRNYVFPRAALDTLTKRRQDMCARLTAAREWELQVVAERDAVVDRIVALA